ncbi:5'-3' exoribonuclease 1 [Cryptococcus neoformans 125.91]|nr:5'-3' exoribonuclease 1 [Cryptococcus neoformans var. grubii 125.91]OXG39735.1 5'-3' exoribonuclease 1 [Cryptococcus neoformans var. grubii Bt120]
MSSGLNLDPALLCPCSITSPRCRAVNKLRQLHITSCRNPRLFTLFKARLQLYEGWRYWRSLQGELLPNLTNIHPHTRPHRTVINRIIGWLSLFHPL